MGNLVALIPLVIFLAVALIISFVARRRSAGEGGFVKEYFIGNRTLGGFVLAMTTIATYGSVSSFVGGPGQAWMVGWGWVYMAVVQVTALVLLYGIVGKKLALVARKLDAVTVIDIVRARYNSNALANISAIIVVLFFAATMVAQFVGGAKLFEAVTGYSYLVGLVLFGAAVILFTTIGGFRGVAFTDALCGIIMLVGIVVLAGGILVAGRRLREHHGHHQGEPPRHARAVQRRQHAGGRCTSRSGCSSGIFTFVLPQSMVRCMGFKDTKALHGAMITGTVIIGPHDDRRHGARRALGRRADRQSRRTTAGQRGQHHPDAPSRSALPAVCWRASPSSARSPRPSPRCRRCSSPRRSAIIKDVYLHCVRATRGAQPSAARASRAVSARRSRCAVGRHRVRALAVVPPDVIWKINMFAFGGLETAFFWVLVVRAVLEARRQAGRSAFHGRRHSGLLRRAWRWASKWSACTRSSSASTVAGVAHGGGQPHREAPAAAERQRHRPRCSSRS